MTPAELAATVRERLHDGSVWLDKALAALDALQAQAEELADKLEREQIARTTLREEVERVEAERDRLAARVSELEAAIAWANGEGDSDFYSEQERKERGLGIYWWRAEISRRAALESE